MKLLITGASGLLGSKLVELAVNKRHQVYPSYNRHHDCGNLPLQIDVSNAAKVNAALKNIQPDAVVHAAALTDVDKCELDKELAWKVNVEGTRNMAEAAKACGAFFFFVSSDYVFDGAKGCYAEEDVPNPINYYGVTKLRAEELVRSVLDECSIVRASVVYGATPAAGKVNFALWLLEKLKRGERVGIVTDQWNSPTLNSSLAEMTIEIIERKLQGLFHLSGRSRVSRFDFSLCLARTFGFKEDLISPVQSSEFSQPAKRPRDSSLDTSKAQNNLRNKPLELEIALKRLKRELGFLR